MAMTPAEKYTPKLKSKEVDVTINVGNIQAAGLLGVDYAKVVSIIWKHTDSAYDYPHIVYRIGTNSVIIVEQADKTAATVARTYTFIVWYLE